MPYFQLQHKSFIITAGMCPHPSFKEFQRRNCTCLDSFSHTVVQKGSVQIYGWKSNIFGKISNSYEITFCLFFPLSHILYGYVCYLLPVNIVYFMALLMSQYTQNILLQKVKVALKF